MSLAPPGTLSAGSGAPYTSSYSSTRSAASSGRDDPRQSLLPPPSGDYPEWDAVAHRRKPKDCGKCCGEGCCCFCLYSLPAKIGMGVAFAVLVVAVGIALGILLPRVLNPPAASAQGNGLVLLGTPTTTVRTASTTPKRTKSAKRTTTFTTTEYPEPTGWVGDIELLTPSPLETTTLATTSLEPTTTTTTRFSTSWVPDYIDAPPTIPYDPAKMTGSRVVFTFFTGKPGATRTGAKAASATASSRRGRWW
ncbi:hypothetical protein DFJ74DRAFT_662990 [Hyaloraphidium curvatum]|nr:hypothetical protein DFJ74DRAFT_662990 [Hyaloraphidium curvatum]